MWIKIRFTKGKFCIMTEIPIHKGLGMLQISVAQENHEIGYARVSRDDRILVLQLAALKKAGSKQVLKCDALSGATTKRPALLRCLKKLEPWRQPPPRDNLSALKTAA